MCTEEQKEQIKKYALNGLKPREIQKKIPELTNKQISDYLRKYSGIAEIKPKIAEKTKEKIIEKIAEKRASAYADYTIDDAFKNFEEIRKLALVPHGDNGKLDLTNAIKAEENKSKLKGLYEVDNKQKTTTELTPEQFAELCRLTKNKPVSSILDDFD